MWKVLVLKPINTAAVIRDGGVVGRFPGEIHLGVAWWVGACLVVVSEADRVVVAHDGQEVSTSFHGRLCSGAVNARHHACKVSDIGTANETELLSTMKALGTAAGAMVTTTALEGGVSVRIAVYDAQGILLTEKTGMGTIRRLIAEDRVPIPVNESAKGRVETHSWLP